MPGTPKKKSLYEAEETWLREYAQFYGVQNVTRFAVEDLNGVSLVTIMEALQTPYKYIRCEKCDGPGSVCEIVAPVGDNETVRITVHFDSQTYTVTINGAEQLEDIQDESETPDAA